jgi:D-amino peptidase
MEGVAGVVTGDHLGPSGFEYQAAREWLTEEVLAAIRGARAAGATEIVVGDSHGNGENILLDRIPEGVRLIRSWPRPLGMVAGIDETFDAVLFIGYHASTTNPEGVRAHTMSSGTLTAVRLNGTPVSEAVINAAIVGHFGVPVVMISGDDAIIAEAREQLGDFEAAEVKWSLGFHSAMTLTPGESQELIAERATAALRRLPDFRPLVLDGPVQVEVSFKNYLAAEVLAYLPIVERVDSHTISFTGQDMVEVSRFLSFMTEYSPSITP